MGVKENFHKDRTIGSKTQKLGRSECIGETLTHSDVIGRIRLEKLEAGGR